MNPKLYSVYCEKGKDFIRKKRRMNAICYYLISGIMGFNAFMQIKLMDKINTKYLFKWSDIWPYAIVLLILIFLVNYLSILTVQKV